MTLDERRENSRKCYDVAIETLRHRLVMSGEAQMTDEEVVRYEPRVAVTPAGVSVHIGGVTFNKAMTAQQRVWLARALLEQASVEMQEG